MSGVSRRTFVTGTAAGAAVAASHAMLPAAAADPVAAAAARQDPSLIPGSKHFATMLAFGDFDITEEGQIVFTKPHLEAPTTPGGPITIACAGIQGLSGVITDREITHTETGQPKVRLNRILTHFQWEDPPVEIEQNPYKLSWGELIGDNPGGVEALLPGKATFYQYLILTAYGRPTVNMDPLIMTSDSVTQWPPVGSQFITPRPTDFYELSALQNPEAMAAEGAPPNLPKVATLAACASQVMSQVFMPKV